MRIRLSETEFESLLSSHKDQLFSFIFCAVHNVPDAEDVFQQTSAVLWEKLPTFDPGSDFGAWAIQIARYKTLQWAEARQRDRHLFSSELITAIAARAAERTDITEARSRALRQCTEKLPAGDRKLLQLCYRREATIKDAAQSLDRPVGSVYDSLSRIRRVLRQCIDRSIAREGLA